MKKTSLYIEPFSGASGDMFLSALCNLSGAYELVKNLPELLHLPDGKVEINQLDKNGIVCQHVKVIDLNTGEISAEVDAERTTDTDHPSDHTHHHDDHHHDHHQQDHDHHHSHAHHHGHEHGPDHTHRTLKEIQKIIDHGHITAGAKRIAHDIFLIIGKSESKIHDMPLETIHFHEVSGVDSILDIVGCAVLLDQLNIAKTYCDSICTGFGSVKTQHGMLPVPAPATFDIIKDMPFHKGVEAGEKLTPTGAAILKYLNPIFQVPPLRRSETAYGPGEKDFHQPNVLRISLVEEVSSTLPDQNQEEIIILECNLDDQRGEYLGQDFQDQLLQRGAVDFYFTSTQMKKGRPGIKLTILVAPSAVDEIANFVLEQTATIGVRYFPVQRKILSREQHEIETSYGLVKIKEVTTPSGSKRRKIEYETIRALAEKHGMSPLEMEAALYVALDHSL